MSKFTYQCSDRQFLEEKFITWEEVGLTSPDQTPAKLFVWGVNSNGCLGLGNTTSRNSPTQLGLLDTWKSVSASKVATSSSAIKTDGTLWTWGYNYYGQLGLNNTNPVSSPTQVGSLTDWKQVQCLNNSAVAIKTDGTLWTWGRNLNGELAYVFTTSRFSSPIQVGSLTDWKLVTSGRYHIFAFKNNNQLWGWGRNDYGQLGLGNTTWYSSPVQIGALTTWKRVAGGGSHSMFIKNDGTLWACGRNLDGELGLGDTTSRSSPVQVGALTNWSEVSCGFDHTIAVKTDGTIWGWGWDATGNWTLGLGDSFVTSKSSPVQIGSMTDWKLPSSGIGNTIVMKTDGTLWGWGRNGSGQLGIPDGTNKSTPVQISSLNKWKSFSVGSDFTLATQYNF